MDILKLNYEHGIAEIIDRINFAKNKPFLGIVGGEQPLIMQFCIDVTKKIQEGPMQKRGGVGKAKDSIDRIPPIDMPVHKKIRKMDYFLCQSMHGTEYLAELFLETTFRRRSDYRVYIANEINIKKIEHIQNDSLVRPFDLIVEKEYREYNFERANP
mgnify:CR=1 FL=1